MEIAKRVPPGLGARLKVRHVRFDGEYRGLSGRTDFVSDRSNGHMNRPATKTVQRRFLVALGHAIRAAWPVLSTILAIQVGLGLLTGFVEGWSVGDAIYFTFITGLTIGYGDIVPRQLLARALAIGIGVSGLILTGLIAAIAVYAMQVAITDADTS